MLENYEEILNNIRTHYPNCRIHRNINNKNDIFINARDIAEMFNFTNIRGPMSNLQEHEKILIPEKTTGGIQHLTYISLKSMFNILSKSRKLSILEFYEKIGIQPNFNVFSCIEIDTLRCIFETFKTEKMIFQYRVYNYRIDLYFVDKKIAIECDENHKDIESDKKREECIKQELLCTFIRYKPYDKDFNIFKLLHLIYLELLK